MLKLLRRKKRAAVIFISLATAASLALLFTLSNTLIFNIDSGVKNREYTSEVKLNKAELESVSTNKNTHTVNNLYVKSVIETNQVSKQQTKELLALNKTNNLELFFARKIVSQILLPEIQETELDNSSLVMRLFEKSIGVNNLANFSILKDSLIIVRNLSLVDQFDNLERKKNKWSIFGQVSSAYSSYKGDKSGGNSENGLISIGGGVKLNWQVGKKLAIQTGVIYNKFGQKLGSEMRSNNQFFSSPIVDRELISQVDFNSTIQTSAGEIKMKGSSLLYSLNNAASTYSSSSPDIIQSFAAIEIPFILRYSFFDKKFGLHMSGGLSTNLMIRNRVYDKSTRETLGETSGIRSTNFSTSFSLGLEYQAKFKV